MISRLTLIALIIFLSSGLSSAARIRNNTVYDLKGRLVNINYRSHRVKLQDEITKLTRSFYLFSKPIKNFKAGDEVRVYFRGGCNELLSIVKMTPVEYVSGKQNKGYIYRAQQ